MKNIVSASLLYLMTFILCSLHAHLKRNIDSLTTNGFDQTEILHELAMTTFYCVRTKWYDRVSILTLKSELMHFLLLYDNTYI